MRKRRELQGRKRGKTIIDEERSPCCLPRCQVVEVHRSPSRTTEALRDYYVHSNFRFRF